jgi:hypothetical protein
LDRRRLLRALVAPILSAVAFGAAARLDPSLVKAASSGPLPAEEAREVLLTLARFQQVYEDFFARGGSPELLNEFPASKELRHQVFRDVGFLRDAGLLQVQDLARAVLMETRWAGRDLAEAVVYEEWNYVFQTLADRKPQSELKGTGQGIRYRLQRGVTGWRVVAWDPVEVVPPETSEPNAW